MGARIRRRSLRSLSSIAIVAGIDTTDSSPVTLVSKDLTTWTPIDSGAEGNLAVHAINNTLFVSKEVAGQPDNYSYSARGSAWTVATTPPTLHTLTWTGSRYVTAVSNSAYTSTNLSSWSGPYALGTSTLIRRLAYSGGVIVAVGQSGGVGQAPLTYSSDEGATWTTYMPTNNFGVYDIVRGPDKFIAVRPRFSGGSDSVLTSTDGTSWSLLTTGIADHAWYNVRYGNGIYLAVGTNNASATRVMTSTDGVTWSVSTPTGLFTSGLAGTSRMAFGVGKFILVNGGDGSIWTSADGLTWTEQAITDRNFTSVAAFP